MKEEANMEYMEVLGANGSRAKNIFTTCFRVSRNVVIDAGNLINIPKDEIMDIEHIFISHTHLDHIVDIAFLIDNTFTHRTTPLKIYGLAHSISIFKKNIFNWDIWPDFSCLKLPKQNNNSIEFIIIEYNKKYIIGDISLTPIKANHTVDCSGYLIKKDKDSILFSGDNYKNKELWNIVNKDKSINNVILDVSFPNRFSNIAKLSKHLTPKDLQDELKLLKREVNISVFHIKPILQQEVIKELLDIGIKKSHILVGGERIRYKDGVITRKQESVTDVDKLKSLNKIGMLLSSEHNISMLLESIIVQAISLTNCDGGTLYLMKDDKIHFYIAQTKSLNILMGGSHESIKWSPIPLYIDNHIPNKQIMAVCSILEDRIINISDVYDDSEFYFEGAKMFDKTNGYKTKSILTVPLKNHKDEMIGVLQLINKLDKDNNPISFDSFDKDITQSLASQSAIAITNANLIEDFENLIESFLHSLIYIIGEKSPHTASHIRQMVTVTNMIIEAVDKDQGIFKNISFNEEQKDEINLSALMHDIGKLSTPDIILNKINKLHIICDAIERIESRCEIIKRDIEIEFLNFKIDNLSSNKIPAKSGTGALAPAFSEAKAITSDKISNNSIEIKRIEDIFTKQVIQINNRLEMIRDFNKGSEFLTQDKIDFINSMAMIPIKVFKKEYYLITKDEAKLLSISKGTLSKSERDIINNHATVTQKALNMLSFPQKYKNVPQISGNHHEKINGTGYPKGLVDNQISFEARILAIADIFEALTSTKREYRKPNSVADAMKILYFMAKDGELDKSLVKFFYDSKLYIKYGQLIKSNNLDELIGFDFNNL
jgi:HD-GYP domain-containing protein (c-di-GMP phosphodiesterase class II)/phosphoribosyl 1,2-cyclic phosphodiesterase